MTVPLKTFAVDVVILPKGVVVDLAIELSRQLKNSSPFVLDATSYFPHISLAMGYVTDLEEAKRILNDASNKFLPVDIIFDSLFRHQAQVNGYHFYQFGVQREENLMRLHEYLVAHLPFVNIQDFRPDYFYRDSNEGDVVSFAYNYVKAFKDQFGRDNYQPH